MRVPCSACRKTSVLGVCACAIVSMNKNDKDNMENVETLRKNTRFCLMFVSFVMLNLVEFLNNAKNRETVHN